ncbi:MAG TPA: hypothetical protein VMS77_02085 [Conexivisphaerales archaeon]|nr:hypothetical protein [Conexivisphaerales archaeon]
MTNTRKHTEAAFDDFSTRGKCHEAARQRTMCCGESAELYEEMLNWEREREKQEKLAKRKKEAPVLTVRAVPPTN